MELLPGDIWGLDVGPTLLFADGGVYPALTLIPFVGVFAYPYFEYTIPFFHAEPISTIGAYLKWPLTKTGFDFFSE